MEELLKMLDIKTINYCFIAFTDNNGNYKEIKIDYPKESTDKEEG